MKSGATPKSRARLAPCLTSGSSALRPKNSTTSSISGTRVSSSSGAEIDYRSPSNGDADRPKYEEQIGHIKEWLDEAKAKGIPRVFITFHYPVFARAGLGPIPFATNPHRFISSYAKDFEITVFNGHVHTTEMYEVDGVKYLMLGGGGAEQDPILPGRTSNKVPVDYPPDLY
jgi:hypothetical protein